MEARGDGEGDNQRHPGQNLILPDDIHTKLISLSRLLVNDVYSQAVHALGIFSVTGDNVSCLSWVVVFSASLEVHGLQIFVGT